MKNLQGLGLADDGLNYITDREKDLCIVKSICASRKRFMHRKKDSCIVKNICAGHREKDLCIAKKFGRSGLNLFLCFALMGFRRISID